MDPLDSLGRSPHLKPMNDTLFENRVFADLIKLRTPMMDILKEVKEANLRHTDADSSSDHVSTEADVGVM